MTADSFADENGINGSAPISIVVSFAISYCLRVLALQCLLESWNDAVDGAASATKNKAKIQVRGVNNMMDMRDRNEVNLDVLTKDKFKGRL